MCCLILSRAYFAADDASAGGFGFFDVDDVVDAGFFAAAATDGVAAFAAFAIDGGGPSTAFLFARVHCVSKSRSM